MRSASAALLTVLLVSSVSAASEGPTVIDRGDDVFLIPGEPGDALELQASDPLGLLVGVDAIRQHSLGRDVFDVWTCGVRASAQSVVDRLEAEVASYVGYHTRGLYEPRFRAKGDAVSFSEEGRRCLERALAERSDANGVLFAAKPLEG